MKFFPNKVLTLIFCSALLCSCEQQAADNQSPAGAMQQAPATGTQPGPANNPNLITGTITEKTDAGGYTFVHLDTDAGTVWAAGPVSPIKVGDTLSISKQMPMSNFYSASLERSFDLIYFVSSFDQSGGEPTAVDMMNPHSGLGQSAAIEVNEPMAKAEGGVTITEIMSRADELAGQSVLVRGKVVKMTPQIQGRDWVHISDSPGTDLTITTTDKVSPGDIVVAEGIIGTDKDFGYGYVYDVIMEDAELTVEK